MTSGLPYSIGDVIRRGELHDRYGGGRRGGISSPADNPFVFIFTGEEGEKYGYKDEFKPDGKFVYTGAGQEGEMTFDRTTNTGRWNSDVRDHDENGDELHLFEKSLIEDAHVVYLGQYSCVDWHRETLPDKNGDERSAIRFRLEHVIGASADEEPETVTEEELWEEAKESASDIPSHRTSTTTEYETSEAVREYALSWADGICQGCEEEAPFTNRNGDPYLEAHHVHRLGDGGPDHPDFVIALCPNCHRRVHHGRRGKQFNRKLKQKLDDRRGSP
ncbi:HNH endonuclease signature motif containing protein [Haloarcula sp. 1CSR25-25]|uniref:HNH endonuclease n=1 Tax=Haloarcula sp. 1CSR25-25 TaxID=2862545 RepID=UPI002895F877|nr:HNH endonuclease signature motif containing protein [Haloarcula sp. 1CSR25-25]MDT3436575.1 HNH endonuclease [Haloarcula sp. 1CSR25-25]